MKHLLKLQDLTREDILSILNLADQLKFERINGVQKDYLKGKKLGLIFQKASLPPNLATALPALSVAIELG